MDKNCYECNGSLNYIDFIESNPFLDKDYLMNLWNNPSVELHCCACNIWKKGFFIDDFDYELELKDENLFPDMAMKIINEDFTGVAREILGVF